MTQMRFVSGLTARVEGDVSETWSRRTGQMISPCQPGSQPCQDVCPSRSRLLKTFPWNGISQAEWFEDILPEQGIGGIFGIVH